MEDKKKYIIKTMLQIGLLAFVFSLSLCRRAFAAGDDNNNRAIIPYSGMTTVVPSPNESNLASGSTIGQKRPRESTGLADVPFTATPHRQLLAAASSRNIGLPETTAEDLDQSHNNETESPRRKYSRLMWVYETAVKKVMSVRSWQDILSDHNISGYYELFKKELETDYEEFPNLAYSVADNSDNTNSFTERRVGLMLLNDSELLTPDQKDKIKKYFLEKKAEVDKEVGVILTKQEHDSLHIELNKQIGRSADISEFSIKEVVESDALMHDQDQQDAHNVEKQLYQLIYKKYKKFLLQFSDDKELRVSIITNLLSRGICHTIDFL